MLRRRYEILLPLKFNDGRDVPNELLNETRNDLLSRFDGISWMPQPIQGLWLYQGTKFEDATLKISVDVDDTAENRQFFVDFKPTLLRRFEQLEIYIVSFPIDRI